MRKRLTIITVTKDDLDGVACTLDSTRKLRGCPGVSQVIIDGSCEPVRKQVQARAGAEENVVYIWREPQGISNAFNHGIETSQSDWLWFLNGRDEAHPDLDPDFLLRMLEATRSEVIIFELEFMQSGLRLSHPPLSGVWPPLYWVPHPATLMRRALFEKYGLFDEGYRIAMDGELWVRFFGKGITADLLSIPVCVFDQNGVSTTDRSIVEREADRIILDNFGFLFNIWFSRGRFLFTALRRRFTSRIFPGKGYRS